MIPKILHLIWVGDDSRLPEQLIQTWVQHHPDWDIRLWGNDDLVGREWRCQPQVRHWGQRDCAAVADIMRWEILLEHGGVCVAADSVCLRSLDDALLSREMFACWVNEQIEPGVVSAAYVGCEPGNPLVARIVSDIANQSAADLSDASTSVGAGRLTAAWRDSGYMGLTVLPSQAFIPRHPLQAVAGHEGEPYACELWATRLGLLDELRALPVEDIKTLLNRSGSTSSRQPTQEPRMVDPQSIHVFMMTVRTTQQMRDIIETLVQSASAYPNIQVTIADGSNNPEKHRWLRELVARTQTDVRLIFEVDPTVRFRMGLEANKAWTLFAADDDPITTNYIESFAQKLSGLPDDVSSVAPSLYLGQIHQHLLLRQVKPVLHDTPAERLMAWQAQGPLQGVLYYSLIRTQIVRDWFAAMHAKPFVPSYADQLLTALVSTRGKITVVDQCSAQVRDEAAWASADACNQSDMRFYPRSDMVIFHEAWWVADLVRLLDVAHRPDLGVALKPRVCELLERMLRVMPSRLNIAQPRPEIDWKEHVAAIKACFMDLIQAQDSGRICALLQAIAEWAASLESILMVARIAPAAEVADAA